MIKEFVQNGCRFMAAVKNTDNISVFKIEVEDGVDTVILDGFQSVIIGRKAEFVFPCVTTLIIGQSVLYIDIPNEMFPNVRNVISHSEIFKTADMLISNGNMSAMVDYRPRLLNTFCRTEDEVVDLSGIKKISDYAFSGCLSTNIINDEEIENTGINAFYGSAVFDSEPVDGVYMAGNMIVGISEQAKEIIIPEYATYYFANCFGTIAARDIYSKCDRVIVRNCRLYFKNTRVRSQPKEIVIDDDYEFTEAEMYNYVIQSNLESIVFTEKNKSFTTYDGILYDKDGKTLIACPPRKSGTVKIKEGTKGIGHMAFWGAMISKVEIPDSVTKIGSRAFESCVFLSEVKLSESIFAILDGCFENDGMLHHITVPDNVRKIGQYAFRDSGLMTIQLGSNVESIWYAAFANTHIKELHVPASVKHLADIGAFRLTDLYLESDGIIPDNTVNSIVQGVRVQDDIRQSKDALRRPYVRVHTPKRTIYVPSYAEATTLRQLNAAVNVHNEFPEGMFLYAPNNLMRHQIAIDEYQHLGSGYAKEHLKNTLPDFVKYYVNNNEEGEIIDLLKLDLIDSRDDFSEVYQNIPDKMLAAKAYLMEMCKNFCAEDFSC